MNFVLMAIMLILCVMGVPIGFGMIISVIIIILIYEPINFLLITQRMIVGMDNFILLAIPFFSFAGLVMTAGGVTDRLILLAKTLVGHWTGGLAHVNVMGSMLFSGISGTATADAVGLGRVEIPLMLESGCPKDFAAAITAASATIGPIIPPSVPMILFGALTGVSIGRLFLGGVLPGILMGLMMMVYIFFVSKKYNYGVQEKASFRQILYAVKNAGLALLLPFLVLGGILGGIFTPTEAAAIAAVYSLIVTMFIYRELSISDLKKTLIESAKLSGNIMFIVAAANVFGQILLIGGLGSQLLSFFDLIGSNKYIVLFMVNVLLLVFGCFIEPTALIIMLGPIFLPLIVRLGIDPVHFGVMMVLALMLGLITPPVGVLGYIMCDITNISLEAFCRAIFPIFMILVLVLFIVTYVPFLTLFIPGLFFN